MNNLITGTFVLPSKAEIYDVKFNPEITLRSMTTDDEIRRLNRSDREYKNMADIIDSCIVENIPISCYDMCLSDYEYLLHKLRVVTYGPEYKMKITCPYCSSSTNETINLEDFQVKDFDKDSLKLEFELPVTKDKIKIYLQTPRMLDNIKLKTKEFKKKHPEAFSDNALIFTIMELINTVNGNKIDILHLEDYIKKLPMKDTNYIIKYADALSRKVGLDTTIEISCDFCGLSYDAPFRLTSELYAQSIDI